jgi:ribose/xylose/arabinose/galactoside ABC-type transport system permease subunit
MKNSRSFALSALKNMPVILFVLIFVAFSLLDKRFFNLTNLENIVSSSAFIGILAVGMTFVLLTGGIDLSVGATMYLSGGILGVLLVNYNWPILPTILVSMTAGTLWGCLNAFLVSKVKVLPFMVTLATLTAGRGLGLLITGSNNLVLPQAMRFSAQHSFIPIVILAFVVVAGVIILRWTPWGRQIYALGNDPEAAKKAGLNTELLTASVYIVSGFCASLAMVVAASQQGNVSAEFANGVEFRAIAATVLGGTSLFGGIGAVFPGAIVGTWLIQMLQNGMIYLQVDIFLQDVVTGGIILLAVLLDSQRTTLVKRLERRNIRMERTTGHAPDDVARGTT